VISIFKTDSTWGLTEIKINNKPYDDKDYQKREDYQKGEVYYPLLYKCNQEKNLITVTFD
jgi:hypothetical protein